MRREKCLYMFSADAVFFLILLICRWSAVSADNTDLETEGLEGPWCLHLSPTLCTHALHMLQTSMWIDISFFR